MNPSRSSPTNAFPLFICGLPRAGTSFLFAVLTRHPAFANENYKDKELRYFERILGNRPWGTIDGVSQQKFAAIDAHIMPHLLRTLDRRLRLLRGGPDGHYINANPRDIFYSEIIREAMPDSRFLIALRDPLTNVWSALNYPAHTWGQRQDNGFFRPEDVRQTAEHWNKVANHILRHQLHQRPDEVFILQQEHLATGDPALHRALAAFLGLEDVAELLDHHADLVIHSSFVPDDAGKGRDRRFANATEKQAHFERHQDMFTAEDGYTALVLDICGPQIRKLADAGIMDRGPSLALLAAT
ncbi:sulfotransferase family protein [Ectothiorhodospira lacustris]|uniref:sulfotransferase family protein n=1 Tax=Ectothiorhodospira lacustris TaxID=2899127 RepID=UPI001EE91D5D|nr:sulfotransferase [Ectothiorhodospira lacustris]MCG5500820.1 sulfotransferase [Ectothiorhodospira lacustris]